MEDRLGLGCGPNGRLFDSSLGWFGVRIRHSGQGEVLADVGGGEKEARPWVIFFVMPGCTDVRSCGRHLEDRVGLPSELVRFPARMETAWENDRVIFFLSLV